MWHIGTYIYVHMQLCINLKGFRKLDRFHTYVNYTARIFSPTYHNKITLGRLIYEYLLTRYLILTFPNRFNKTSFWRNTNLQFFFIQITMKSTCTVAAVKKATGTTNHAPLLNWVLMEESNIAAIAHLIFVTRHQHYFKSPRLYWDQ